MPGDRTGLRWCCATRTTDPSRAGLETEAGRGFRGQAAAGFGEAINEWFDVAVTLGPILEGYAQSLMYVAQEHQTNDVAQAQRAGQLADRLGGGGQ